MLALALLLLAQAHAAVPANVSSAAMRQLENVEGVQPDAEGDPAKAKDKGTLGFTIDALKPIGYKATDAEVPETPVDSPLPPAPKAPLPGNTPSDDKGAIKRYIFEGHSDLKGVTIYTPKEDATGEGRTEEPKREPPVSNKIVYGALAAGAAAVVAGFLWFPPLLLLGGILLGAGAVMWYINKKFS